MKLLKNWKVITIVVVVVAVALIFFLTRDKGPAYEFATVKRGNVVQEVSVTGRVKPAEDVDLGFEISGRVSQVNVEVGDRVYAGQILLRLDDSGLQTELAKAESDLAAQQAKLSESQVSLTNAYVGAIDVLNDAYLKADEAVHIKTTALFSGTYPSFQLTFKSCDSQTENDAKNYKVEAEGSLKKWKSELNALSKNSSEATIKSAILAGEEYLVLIQKFLNVLDSALNSTCLIGQTSLDAARINVNAARTSVNNALTAVNSKEQSINSQQAVVASNQAAVASYEAAVANIKTQLVKTYLRAPISGVVSVQNAETGEIVAAQSAIVSVISASRLEIEANIAEVDIVKIKLGDAAKVTLDAYRSDVVWEVVVSEIDPAETIIDGVPTYKTVFQFKESDDRIKSGMTANIDVLTAKKEGVLYIPQRAVVSENGRGYVRVLKGKNIQQVDVVTGLRGSDATVEITSGLAEGDEVIVFEK